MQANILHGYLEYNLYPNDTRELRQQEPNYYRAECQSLHEQQIKSHISPKSRTRGRSNYIPGLIQYIESVNIDRWVRGKAIEMIHSSKLNNTRQTKKNQYACFFLYQAGVELGIDYYMMIDF